MMFAVYSDAACTKKVTEVTTGNDGAVLIDNLDGGAYYVKEIATVKPYVIDGLVNTVVVKASGAAKQEVFNETAKGQIRITKQAETLVSTTASKTEFGQLHRPNYQTAGLPGCTFVVKNSAGTVVGNRKLLQFYYNLFRTVHSINVFLNSHGKQVFDGVCKSRVLPNKPRVFGEQYTVHQTAPKRRAARSNRAGDAIKVRYHKASDMDCERYDENHVSLDQLLEEIDD